jgi:glutathione synthase/RimK-type ligase-like ATP-grasp enzyme
MSASSYTRDHRYAPELTRHVLNWLESHGRRVVNDSRALALEIDKLAQYAALAAAGVETPRTSGAVGRAQVAAAAEELDAWPLILKPNRGGAGAGVALVESRAHLAAILDDPATPAPLDGTWLVQDYVQAREPCITRCEFIGGRFYYAVRVDTSDGFELCPADACALQSGREKFEILPGFDDPVIARYEDVLARNGIEVAGIEFVRRADGSAVTYDINTNTNYNSRAEAAAGVSGMGRLADVLGAELARRRAAA